MGYHDKNIFLRASALLFAPDYHQVPAQYWTQSKDLLGICGINAWTVLITEKAAEQLLSQVKTIQWGRAGEAEFLKEQLHFTKHVCSVGELGAHQAQKVFCAWTSARERGE